MRTPGPGRPKGLPKTGGRKPGSKNKIPNDVRILAQSYTTEAIDALVKAMRDAPDASARIQAARVLLDRGWGAPKVDVSMETAVYVIGDRPLSATEWEAQYADTQDSVAATAGASRGPDKVPAAGSVLRGGKRRRERVAS